MLLLLLVVILDYKLTKFEQTDISQLDQEKISGVNSNRIINTVFISLIPIVFIFAFLNTFSFNWIRSQIDDNKDIYLSAIEVGKHEVEFGPLSNSSKILIKEVYLTPELVRIDIKSEKTPEPIELILNGKSYFEENAHIIRGNNFFWKDTYFLQQYSFYLDTEVLEKENWIKIRCGDIEKEYTLSINQIKLAYSILDNGKNVLRGHSFGDSIEQVMQSEAEEPKRIYNDTINENVTKLVYDNRSFFGYNSDITYTFENDRLYNIIVSAGAFSPFDDRTPEDKCNQVIKKMEVLGEPDVKGEVTFSDAFFAEWQSERYHIFLYVYPGGFSFIAEQQSGND